jgi:hypothetical protein
MNAGYMAHAAVTAAVARGNLPKAGTQIGADGAPAVPLDPAKPTPEPAQESA